MGALVWVAAGGALGSCARYGLAKAVSDTTVGAGFPLGTLSVNLLGCLLIGALAAHLLPAASERASLHLFLIVGLLGGFTTFSSFGLECVQLLEAGRVGTLALYVVLSNLGGLVLAWGAWRLSARWVG